MVVGWGLSAMPAVASSFVERLSPPSLGRGSTVRVTITGSELSGALALWTSLPAKTIEATLVEPSQSDHATFDVKVSPDAPLGLYGLRLATRSGLSNAKLFLIDDLASVAEQESDAPGAPPQKLSWPVAVLGRARESDIDRYAIDVQAGQRLSFEVVGSRLGQDFDPVVVIKDARGRHLLERDNDIGLIFDCRFAHTFEKAGTYTIEVHDTRFRGSEHRAYVLRVGRFPEGRVAFPSSIRPGDDSELSIFGEERFTQHIAIPKDAAPASFYQVLRRSDDQASAWVPLQVSPLANTLEHEPNNDPAHATAARVPSVLHGTIATPNDRDAFAFDLESGQRVTGLVECRSLGAPTDLDMSLSGPDGKLIKRLDTLPDGELLFEVQAASKGRYVVAVRSLTGEGGLEYVYRITLALREPSVRLISEASSLAIPRGSYQPLPLSLTRTDFSGPIALELRGAPVGMTLRTAAIREGETDVVNAIQVAEGVPEGLYSVQVLARMEGEGAERTTLATTLPLIDRLPIGHGPHGEPFELREDQRRLPPTLTDRVAVLVTSPSPFTFELPDRVVVVPRYLEAPFRIETTRIDGFDGSITFTARGGTLDPLRLRKPRVVPQIPLATRGHPNVSGVLRSGVESELVKHRVTVTAHASHDGRDIDLTRTFDLQTKVAYEPSADPQRIEVAAGKAATIAILANRLAPFRAPIAIHPSGEASWNLPQVVEIAESADRAELKIAVPVGTKPGMYRISIPGSARVSKFDEAVTGRPIEVVVIAPKGGRS
jgi:hypothetical protein